jgi:hypothetical protein
MASAGVVIIYLVFCLLVGLCGTRRRMGFVGTFVLSFFITPILMVLVLLVTAPVRSIEQ